MRQNFELVWKNNNVEIFVNEWRRVPIANTFNVKITNR